MPWHTANTKQSQTEPTPHPQQSKLAFISEPLCIGCGICVKKCPFEAVAIINLPKDLERNTTHRYGPNSFKLHRLPMPRPGQVLGLVGTNGIGKSTALKVRVRNVTAASFEAIFEAINSNSINVKPSLPRSLRFARRRRSWRAR